MLVKPVAFTLTTALLFMAAANAQVQRQPTTQAEAPTRDMTYIAPDGTAYITRIVPVPVTVSPEAQKRIGRQIPDVANDAPSTLADDRKSSDQSRERSGKAALERYPANVADGLVAGVPVRVVTPPTGNPARKRFLLINVHGGAYEFDCCSLAESIPMANIMQTEVISVLYRLAPENPFPAGVDDVIRVYREVLKSHAPSEIAIYGTSSGAVITGEVAMKLKTLGLPQPAALGIFSGFGDFSQQGDSQSFFTGAGLGGYLTPSAGLIDVQRAYVGATRLDDPVLSPMKGDLSGFPPTLFLTSTRDWFLSGTSLFHRAMLRAGDQAELVVFEGLNHGFWLNPTLPESDEAYRSAANFFGKHLKSGDAPLVGRPMRVGASRKSGHIHDAITEQLPIEQKAYAEQKVPETPSQVVQSAIAAMRSGDLPRLNQIFAPEGPWHLPGGAERAQGGPYAELSGSCPMCARLADRQIQIEVLVARDDLVSVRTRWTGRYTGVIQGVSVIDRPVKLTYQNIYRVSGGRIVENWADYNSMDLARQLGFTVTTQTAKPSTSLP